jgi:hypothetical protein
VCVQVQQALKYLEGPALDRHVTDVTQVLLAIPAQQAVHAHVRTQKQQVGARG